MPGKPQALLPSPQVIQQLRSAGLSPEMLTALLVEDRRGKQQYALTSTVMGGICFAAVGGGFIYLVMNGHDIAAGSLLGVEVLAILKQMLSARL